MNKSRGPSAVAELLVESILHNAVVENYTWLRHVVVLTELHDIPRVGSDGVWRMARCRCQGDQQQKHSIESTAAHCELSRCRRETRYAEMSPLLYQIHDTSPECLTSSSDRLMLQSFKSRSGRVNGRRLHWHTSPTTYIVKQRKWNGRKAETTDLNS